jgi:glutathione synthase/RimK-type ligase-like ATP-grasp enzyme
VGGDPDQVVNNVAQGASAHRVEFDQLDPADQRTILEAARRMPDGGDVAGWDLIGVPGERRIIEGNSGPGLPDGSEGIHVPDVVRGYGVLLRDRALQAAGAQ